MFVEGDARHCGRRRVACKASCGDNLQNICWVCCPDVLGYPIEVEAATDAVEPILSDEEVAKDSRNVMIRNGRRGECLGCLCTQLWAFEEFSVRLPGHHGAIACG